MKKDYQSKFLTKTRNPENISPIHLEGILSRLPYSRGQRLLHKIFQDRAESDYNIGDIDRDNLTDTEWENFNFRAQQALDKSPLTKQFMGHMGIQSILSGEPQMSSVPYAIFPGHYSPEKLMGVYPEDVSGLIQFLRRIGEKGGL